MQPEPGLRRCHSISPRSNVQCVKNSMHNRTEPHPKHKNGDFIWDGPEFPFKMALGKPTHISFTPVGGPPIDLTDAVSSVMIGERVDERELSKAETELRGWWFDIAEREIDQTVPKAIEYSSTDLVDIGRTMAYCMGRTVDDEEAAELGVFFYMQGKMSRWAGAIKTGKRVSDDTLFDIGIYVRMTQRIRHAGGWPGVNLDDE